MSAPPLFSVIIPVFNKWELTANCLRSLREHTRDCDIEVIVVDNGSSDETAGDLPSLGGELFGRRFLPIRFEENRNFGPACNAGARAASAPLVFFLNNDTVLTPGWAPPLLQALAEDPSLGGVGPLLLYEDETVQHLGVAFSPSCVGHLYNRFPADHPVVCRKRYFQAITAAALMMSREEFLQHGGFFEAYRNGFEDVDLCLRIAQTGKRFTCVTESKVFHLESKTPGRKDNETRNSMILYGRCGIHFRSDKHLHGLSDGFLPFINDFLDIGLRLTEEGEAALVRELDGKNVEEWRRCCRANPYWVRGREQLAGILEKHGHVAESLKLRADVTNVLVTAASSKEFMLAAARLDCGDVLADATYIYRELMTVKQDKALCRKRLRMAVQHQDRLLESLYEEKLKEISQ